MNLTSQLATVVAAAFEAAGYDPKFGVVAPTERAEFGDFQANGALVASKQYGKAPREIAEAVVAELAGNDFFTKVEVAGPGFINLHIANSAIVQATERQLADSRLGIPTEDEPKKIFLDYSSPNAAKPLHVGHLRSSIIGQTIKEISSFMGNEVIGDVHLGDWGTQMGMNIRAIQREQPNLPYFDETFSGPYPEECPVTMEDLARMYPAQSALAKEDPSEHAAALEATVKLQAKFPGYYALWERIMAISLEALRRDLGKLGVRAEEWHGESYYNDMIPSLLEELKATGKAVESNGALVIFVDSDLPPLILLKSDGAYLYATTDMATIKDHVARGAERCMYVVDKRQSLHFDQLFKAARLTGLASEGVSLEFFGFGTINGPDGKPFKTRAGGVMQLNDLIDMVVSKAAARMAEAGLADGYDEVEKTAIANSVGMAALKFGDLVNNLSSDYTFDLERFSSFEGKTGPYLVYTGVRIKSIFRKVGAERVGHVFSADVHPREREVFLLAGTLPDVFVQAYSLTRPHILCEYIFTLCQAFNRFYQECNIMHEEDETRRDSWLATCDLVLCQIELVTQMLGIAVPERM